jgi:hypothetical protein
MNILPASQFTPETPGLYAGIPMAQYQAAPGFSGSRAAVLRRSPLDFIRMQNGELDPKPTDSMELGTVYHSLVWEGRRDFHIRPDAYKAPESAKKDAPMIDKPWNANATACQNWLEAHSDMPVYSAAKAKEIESGAEYLELHPRVRPILFRTGMVEVSMFARAEKHGYILKGRADKVWFDQGRINFADLKTTRDASTDAISREILNRGYHIKAAYYRYIAQRLGYEFGDFLLIFFEDGAAPKVNVRRLAPRAMDEGMHTVLDDINLLHRCRLMNFWPEFADMEQDQAEIQMVDLPDYVYGDEISISTAA